MVIFIFGLALNQLQIGRYFGLFPDRPPARWTRPSASSTSGRVDSFAVRSQIHGPNFPFFWGRGNGWVAAGMAELLSELPANHPQHARIMQGYLEMMASLLKFQDADGMWHQLIDHPESYPETSCTGMFTFAMITGVKNGWLKDKACAEAARKGWLGLIKFIDADGNLDKVCVGTGQNNSLQFYLNRPTQKGNPHGQAPVLWCAMALLKN